MTTVETDVLTPDDQNDFDLEVLAARRRRRLPVATAALCVGVIAAVAFIGGVEIQKHYGGSSASSATAGAGAFASRLRGLGSGAAGTAPAAARGGFGAAGGATIGTVTVIKGKTLYVTDTSGNTVKVTAGPSARVTKTVSSSATFSSINPGDTVVVQGTSQKNGTVAASSISLGTGAAFGAGASSPGGAAGGATGFGNGGATGFGG